MTTDTSIASAGLASGRGVALVAVLRSRSIVIGPWSAVHPSTPLALDKDARCVVQLAIERKFGKEAVLFSADQLCRNGHPSRIQASISLSPRW